jgi:hypothetical protein
MALTIHAHGCTKKLSYTYFGEGPYLGLELEVDSLECKNKEELHLDIATILDRPTLDSHYMLERDSSLKNGLEIIFQPHSYVLLKDFLNMHFSKILTELKDATCLGGIAPFAGLHIHVSKIFFGETLEEQQENIAKV